MRILLEKKTTALILTRNIFHLKDYVVVAMTTATMKVKIFSSKTQMSLNMTKSQLVQLMVLILLIVMETT